MVDALFLPGNWPDYGLVVRPGHRPGVRPVHGVEVPPGDRPVEGRVGLSSTRVPTV